VIVLLDWMVVLKEMDIWGEKLQCLYQYNVKYRESYKHSIIFKHTG